MMKRSRRSLGLLLASMALSLVVLRATTLPGKKTVRVRQDITSFSAGRLNVAKSAAQQTLRTNTSKQPIVPLRDAPVFTSRAVSMSAVIIVIPHPLSTEPARQGDANPTTSWTRRAGWSGCTAYANGCDHLGSTHPSRRYKQSGTRQRRFFSALDRLFTDAVAAASASADLVARLAAYDRSTNLARDAIRPKQDR